MHLEQIMVGPMAVFAYIVGDPQTKEAALIDPAANEEMLVDRVAERGFTLKTIINTHGHADHISGNKLVKELTGARIIIGTGDAEYLTPKYADRCRAFGFSPSPPADETVNHGDVIRVGNLGLEVRHTPGHTRGGMCLVVEGHVFTGDTLFVGAIGRTDLDGGSFDQLMDSINTQILTLPDETVVWPGHAYGPRPKSTVGQERETNPYIRDYLSAKG